MAIWPGNTLLSRPDADQSTGISHLDPVRQKRAGSFGQLAEDYDRYRPGYPDQLFDDVLALTAENHVLEAGCGTGRATLGLASRGARVVAVEHDPAMVSVARRRTQGLAVELIESQFEDYAPAPADFDLVTCAQAWHWIDPVRGPEIAATALKPGGALCIWWNRPVRFEGPVWNAIHAVYQQHAPHLDRQTAVRERGYSEPMPEPADSFAPWTLQIYEWTQSYSAEDYARFLGTHSDHIILPQEQRDSLLDAVRTAISAQREPLTYEYRTLLYVARRA